MEANFQYVFPAIRGIQAGREYYVSMCPLRLIPKIFIFDEEELVPELRAQRLLNKGRLPELSRYILNNAETYTFSAITASIDGTVIFAPYGDSGEGSRLGLLRIPMDAQFVINDGQHRRAAIEMALRETPELGEETIAVVFFMDLGLERCQQMFADLNRYAIRPTRSLSVLYDHRDAVAMLTKRVVLQSEFFRGLVEMERSTLSARSRKLFTLSSIYSANSALLRGAEIEELDETSEMVGAFWDAVAKQFPEWQQVKAKILTAAEIRRDFIHSYGVVLKAIGCAGNAILRTRGRIGDGTTLLGERLDSADSNGFRELLAGLGSINWSRTNTELWEGRAMIGGRVSKANNNVVLTTNVIKRSLGIELSPEEGRVERHFEAAAG